MQSALQKYARQFFFIASILTAVVLTCGSHPILAAPVGYDFSAKVGAIGGTPWGVSVAANSLISGRFYYDPNTPALHPTGTTNDTSIYPQLISGGLTATIGGLTLSADSYAIEVTNNLTRGNSSVDDIEILFYSSLSPGGPVDPIMVNGVGYSSGRFDLVFQAPSSYISSSALPTQLNYSDFTVAHSALLGDESPAGSIDVPIINIASLTQIPMISGDLNCDGHVDESDLSSLMQLLTDPHSYEAAHDLTDSDAVMLGDLNHSGSVDNGDLQALIDILHDGNGSATPVPEASGVSLLSTATCIVIAYVCRQFQRK